MFAAQARSLPFLLPASDAPKAQGYFNEALAFLILLNLLDAGFTAFWVASGRAVEANPIMATLLQVGIAPFILGKLSMVFAASMVLRQYRDRALSQLGVRALVVAYSLVAFIHLSEFQRIVA